MNWLDIVILIFLLISLGMGLRRGLIQSLVPVVGLLIAIPLAGVLTDPVASKIGNASWSHILAFIIIFAVVFIVVSIGAWFLRRFVKLMLLGWVDNLGGAVFGFISGWLLCSMMIILVARYGALPVDVGSYPGSGSVEDWLDAEGRGTAIYNTIDDSVLARAQVKSIPIVLKLLPGEFDDVQDFFGED